MSARLREFAERFIEAVTAATESGLWI